ncbi:MAG: phospholipase D family protein [Chloroflexota bacterium]
MDTMFRLVDSAWVTIVKDAVAKDHSELRIICPFIKKRTAERLLQAGHPKIIHVITRFCLPEFCDGVSDTDSLRLLLSSGAKIRGVRNLHAKVYLFGGSRVVVTSANLTEAALLRNHEFGFVADEAGIVTRCREYFDTLWQKSGPDLTLSRLDSWEKQLDAVRAAGAPRSWAAALPDEGVDAGVATPPISVPPQVADASQSFVKFFGEGHNRSEHTGAVLDEIERSGCHWACTYPEGKRPRRVEDSAVMFMGRLMKQPNDVMIYGRAVALRHHLGRDDATLDDIARRPWKADWPHYVRVHHGEFVTGTLSNGISLNRMMDDLVPSAFASTRRNLLQGKGNTNPRRAYRQQPHVELTDEAFGWLSAELEDAFEARGRVPTDELERLDWPAGLVPSTTASIG